MPAKASELEKVARKLGFEKARQKGSHARCKHPDGRATTIPIHGNPEIGGWLFQEILKQLYHVRGHTHSMSLRVERSETTQSQGFWDCFPTLRERFQRTVAMTVI